MIMSNRPTSTNEYSKLCDVILAIVKNLYQPLDSDLDKWTSRVPNDPNIATG